MPDVLMPRLSDTMTEGVVGQWLKHEGDMVQRGDTLAEIETDKATMELEAYDSGVLTRIIAPSRQHRPHRPAHRRHRRPAASADRRTWRRASVSTRRPIARRPRSSTPAIPRGTRRSRSSPDARLPAPVRATPLVRSLAREHGIDLAAVTGTGPGGRIVRADIEAVISQRSAAARAAKPAASAVVPSAVGSEGDEQVPLSSIRRITAQRLTESAAAPHFYLTCGSEADALQKLRAEFNTGSPIPGRKSASPIC